MHDLLREWITAFMLLFAINFVAVKITAHIMGGGDAQAKQIFKSEIKIGRLIFKLILKFTAELCAQIRNFSVWLHNRL